MPQDTQAVPGDVVKGNTGVRTGGDSRAELQFPDLTITRVGSNSLFRFIAGTREMILDSGTLLFSSPAGAGGGKVSAGAITAAVTGSDFMISNVGRVKVICLSHKVTVYLTANPKIRAELRPGQLLDITPGTIRKMPRVTTINLGKLLATSKLAEAGGFRPLASQAILVQNTNRQAKAFSLAKADLTSESAEEVRSTTEFASSSSSQSRHTAAAQTTRETEEATLASSTGNNENRGNSGNNENRGNSGNNENPAIGVMTRTAVIAAITRTVAIAAITSNGNPGNSGKK
jgi:FecR protein